MLRISRIPEPALIRSTLVAISGVIAFLVGHAIDTSWVDSIVTIYGLLTPILAGVLIRPAVTPARNLGGGS